ncbi:MAG: hypothetical protein A2X36_13145 [Elusimicrobia bacterium GWA2_69_24]|nr:MAG: hypothetical protein A2X36_13145 [Elusimicrobia bacterium GWA2_69_24]
MRQPEAVSPEVARALALKHTFTVDASFDQERSVAGIGMVVQAADRPGRKGPVIAECSEAYAGVPSGFAEEFAVFRSLQIAAANGWRRVVVRSDCNGMRRRIRKDHRAGRGKDRGDLGGAVLRLAAVFDEVRFSYVPRRKNQRAHLLARRAAKTLAPKMVDEVRFPDGK